MTASILRRAQQQLQHLRPLVARVVAQTHARLLGGDAHVNALRDFRDAVRLVAKQPRFLLVASLTLALGIGAVTSIFSVVNGVLLTPLPYPQPDRPVNIWSSAPGVGYDRVCALA